MQRQDVKHSSHHPLQEPLLHLHPSEANTERSMPDEPASNLRLESELDFLKTTEEKSIEPVQPRSPSLPSMSVEVKSDGVNYLPPDFISFADIQTNSWILAPQSEVGFIQWARGNNLPWIYEANAQTEHDLLKAVNGKAEQKSGVVRGLTVAASVMGHAVFGAYAKTRNIKPGEIHFSDNGGQPEIYVTPGIHYLANPRHTWGNIRQASDDVIKEGNITIVRIWPGSIGLAEDNGRPIVLLPGTHAYNSNLFKLEEKNIIDTRQEKIQFRNISIVRVLPNELGLAWKNRSPVLLLPGLHIYEDPTFQLRGKLDVRNLSLREEKNDIKSFFEHDTITLIRLEKNQLGCAMNGREPVLLLPGVHIKNNRAFKIEDVVDANSQHIHFNTVHVIQVKAGEIGLAWNDNKPVMLKAGVYKISSTSFKFEKFCNENDKLIQHGPITIVRVNQGELGYAWDKGEAIELAPGLHYREDPQFIFDRCERANKEVIQFGNITHVIVKSGEARAINLDGALRILSEGRHDFTSPTLTVAAEPIPLQDVIMPLHEIKVTTRDRMPMHVTGQVTYNITDPEKLIKSMGQDSLKVSLEKCADAILRQQMSLADLSIITLDHHHEEKRRDSEASHRLFGDQSHGEGDNFRGKLCSAVQQKLSQDTQGWGIKIREFAISDIGFQDKNVEQSLASATAQTRQAEAQYDLQGAQNATAISKVQGDSRQQLMAQESAAKIMQLKTESETASLMLKAKQEAESKAMSQMIAAKAEAEVQKIKAQTEADVQKIKADAFVAQARAEMEAAKHKAEGESVLTKAKLLLIDNPHYMEIRMAELEVEAAKYRATASTPSVVFNGNTSSDRAVESMFFGQGVELAKYGANAQQQRIGMFAMNRSNQPASRQVEQKASVPVLPSPSSSNKPE